MKPPVFRPTIRKTGIDRPTPANLVQVADQMRALLLELQGSVGPPELRAVRLQELMRIGVVIRQPEGDLAAGCCGDDEGSGGVGPPGPPGPPGDPGADGADGADGTSIFIEASIASWEDLPVPSGEVTIDVGDIYIATEDFTIPAGGAQPSTPCVIGDGIEWNGTYWINIGQIRGPAGADGAPGGAEDVITDTSTVRVLTAGDSGKLIVFTNASPITVTVNAGVLAALSSTYFRQSGAGQVSVVAGVGVVIETADTVKTRAQECTIGIKQESLNNFMAFGDTEPVAPALAVLARAVNSAGPPSWVAAAAIGAVLKRSGAVLDFDTLTASEIENVPSGNVTSTNVQGAIDELGAQYGGALAASYKFSTSTASSDPASGKVRFNDTTYAAVTEIYVSQTTDGGTDAENVLAAIRVGDIIYVQDKDDATKWLRALVSTLPTDNGAWWTIPITAETYSAGAMISNNAKLLLIAIFSKASSDVPLDTTLSYIGDKLDVVTTSAGTKTMVYTGDQLTSIIGTGIYPSKNFTYTGDLLTGVDVL